MHVTKTAAIFYKLFHEVTMETTNPSNILILFDLDETLIHATTTALDYIPHFTFDSYFVYERPGVRDFLTAIAQHFSIGIWSSAGDVYVQQIVQQLLPSTLAPVIVWGQSKCSLKRDMTYDTYVYEKRLDKLKKKGFRMEQILIIDDSPEKARTNYGNAIYIKAFIGSRDDIELQHLYHYLLTFKTVDKCAPCRKAGLAQRVQIRASCVFFSRRCVCCCWYGFLNVI